MKKMAILLCVLSGMPLLANAGVSIDIHSPGISIQLGDRDQRGYYWDGYDWRAPAWWHDWQGRHVGARGPRGDYWNGNGWQPHAPQHHSHSRPQQQNHHQPEQPQHNHHAKPGAGNDNPHQRPPAQQRH